MSGLFNKIKDKVGGGQGDQSNEQSFSIQPHPAKSNDPKDVEGPQLGAGLNSQPEIQAHHARDPFVPSEEIRNNLPPPQSRDELRAKSAELNKQTRRA